MKTKIQRCEEEAKRLAVWRALNPVEQLKDLDARLGQGQGAVRQRMRLTGKMLVTPTPDDMAWGAKVVERLNAEEKKGKRKKS
jgi:hypothetical protein